MSLLVNLKIVTCFNLFHIQVTVYKVTTYNIQGHIFRSGLSSSLAKMSLEIERNFLK